MYPSTPEEKYTIEIPPMKQFPDYMRLRFVVRVYPSQFVFELFINSTWVWTYQKEREFLL